MENVLFSSLLLLRVCLLMWYRNSQFLNLKLPVDLKGIQSLEITLCQAMQMCTHHLLNHLYHNRHPEEKETLKQDRLGSDSVIPLFKKGMYNKQHTAGTKRK